MKKIGLLILACVFMASMSVSAQEQTPQQGNKGERKQVTAQVRAERLAKDLSLTDEQKAKVQAMYEKNDGDFAKLRAEVKGDDPTFRKKMKELRGNQDAELKTIIGDEKYDQMQKMRAERMQKMKEKNGSN